VGIHQDALGKAAIAVLAQVGGRGFTHRAVDRRAGLPEGTASRYARSRAALLELASNTLFDQDIAEARNAPAPTNGTTGTADDVAQLLTKITKTLLKSPERYRARVELQLEAARAPTLRSHLRRSRATFITALDEVLQEAGIEPAHQHSDLLVTVVDAILHRRIVLGGPPIDDRQMQALFCAVLGAANTRRTLD
jgi:DNA-binding transcriptional regulator YbjK